MKNFDQLKAMAKMVRWVKKKDRRVKENLRRNLAKRDRGRAAKKAAKLSNRRNRNG